MADFPARLHILLAREAPVGLVIRRGPSKQVATLLWDRQRDTFQFGQWLKGRIYEHRSDLSPDGKYIIYFAMNFKWASETKGVWTAISCAPYLKALTLFPKGDTWQGGGLWTGKTTYWVNGAEHHSTLYDSNLVSRDPTHPLTKSAGEQWLGIYHLRLIRDGWKLVEYIRMGEYAYQNIFEKPVTQGWVLRKITHPECNSPEGKGYDWEEHELVNRSTYQVLAFPDWEWADLDGQRLVWAMAGKLQTAKLHRQGLVDVRELYDFNDMKFTPILAPY